MYPFKKLLKLPSNGLSYTPFVKVKPLTNAFFYGLDDKILQTNFTEAKASLLEPFVDFSPYQMYYDDLIFLWNYFMTVTFKNPEITKPEICTNCNIDNEVAIPLEDLDIVYAKEKKEVITLTTTYNNKPMSISYRRRKVLDNIESSLDNIDIQNALNDPLNYMNYFANIFYHQIVSISYEDKVIETPDINKETLYDIFSYCDDKAEFIFLLYEKLIAEQDFGIMNNIGYICKNCNQKNKVKFSDAIIDSFFITNIKEDNKKSIGYLEFVREGFIGFEELLNLPIVLNEPFFQYCLDILEKQKDSMSGNAIDYRKFHGLG